MVRHLLARPRQPVAGRGRGRPDGGRRRGQDGRPGRGQRLLRAPPRRRARDPRLPRSICTPDTAFRRASRPHTRRVPASDGHHAPAPVLPVRDVRTESRGKQLRASVRRPISARRMHVSGQAVRRMADRRASESPRPDGQPLYKHDQPCLAGPSERWPAVHDLPGRDERARTANPRRSYCSWNVTPTTSLRPWSTAVK